MTPAQINRRLAKAGRLTMSLANLSSLREAARLAAEQLPVRWSFEPGTPAELVDYLAAGVQGAFEGAAIGYGIGMVLAVLFPPAVIGYAAVAGAALGAAHRTKLVEQGWRIRLLRDSLGRQMIEVRRVA